MLKYMEQRKRTTIFSWNGCVCVCNHVFSWNRGVYVCNHVFSWNRGVCARTRMHLSPYQHSLVIMLLLLTCVG